MNKASQAWAEILAMDELSSMDSPIHRLHPLAKLFAAIGYILLVVSFPKYDLTGIFTMVLYPVLLYRLAGIPVRTCFVKLRVVLPLVMAVGIVNPFLDKAPMLRLGSILISRGVVSMLTLMLKGIFSLMISFLLVATTKVDALCASLRKIHVPEILVTLFLLTYRYISVMVEQVSIMSDAYALRAPGQKGIHISAWGSFLGQLLLRSMDRATELYQSMLQRGFNGSFTYLTVPEFTGKDALFLLLSAAALLALRYGNLAVLLGKMMV